MTSCSWKKKRNMAKAQDTLTLKKHYLVIDYPTRWGSQQKMVERILEQETADRKTSHLIPSWQDVDVLESLKQSHGFPQRFYRREAYVTTSTVKLVVHHLTTVVLMSSEEDTLLTKDINLTRCCHFHGY